MVDETKKPNGDGGSSDSSEGDSGDQGQIEQLRTELAKRTEEAKRHAKRAERITALESEVKKLNELIAAQEKESSETPDPTPGKPDAETARLNRELKELRSKFEEGQRALSEADEKRRKSIQEAAIESLMSSAGVLARKSAKRVLIGETKLADDERTLMYPSKDETGETIWIELTVENLYKAGLLEDEHFPAKGTPGSGGKPPKPFAGTGGDVVARGLMSQKEFDKNYHTIVQSLKEQQGR